MKHGSSLLSMKQLFVSFLSVFCLFILEKLTEFIFGTHGTWIDIIQWPILFIASLIVLSILQSWIARKVETVIVADLVSTKEEKQETKRQGLIVFLSLYGLSPSGSSKLKAEPWYDENKEEVRIKVALEKKDYKALYLDDDSLTNYGVPTMAIKEHATELKYVWIVTSESKRSSLQSSSNFLSTYMTFLREESIVRKEVEFITDYKINIDEDSQVSKRTSEVVQKIYKRASESPFNLSEKQIIVDVTSGTKSMTVGAVLGSIAQERDIQLFTSDYKQGKGWEKVSGFVHIKYFTRMYQTGAH
jgi:hypothetical protein